MNKTYKVAPVQVGRYRKETSLPTGVPSGLPTIEETGRGKQLFFDTSGGRIFRDDEGALKESIDVFIENYEADCRRFDEDPAHIYIVDVHNYNEIYSLIGITPSDYGAANGWTNVDGYRCDNMEFRFHTMQEDEKSEFLRQFNEPIIAFGPVPDSRPSEYYREV